MCLIDVLHCKVADKTSNCDLEHLSFLFFALLSCSNLVLNLRVWVLVASPAVLDQLAGTNCYVLHCAVLILR